MPYDVELTNSPWVHTAVIRSRVQPGELSRFVPAACGEVWAFIRSAALPQPGRHVALYLEGQEVEVGAEVSAPFTGNDRISCSQLPSGRVATTVHFGPYSRLSEAHAAIHQWCIQHKHAPTGISWEIYGHWDESWNTDPSKIRTDVFHLLTERSRSESPGVEISRTTTAMHSASGFAAPASPALTYREICPERDAEEVAAFLSKNTWPFHGQSTLSLGQARMVKLGPHEQVRSFWIQEDQSPVGMMRVLDLEDADTGSVLFDLRIAEKYRGRGIGRAAVAWLVPLLFGEYPSLHRIEAATRIDNHAMRRVLEHNKFVLEGRLRQTWRGHDGTHHDTALYGRLRSDI